MLLEVGLIAVGIPAGWLLRRSAAAQRITGHVLTVVIWLLLFLLGFTLGSDDTLVARFRELGMLAAVISGLGLAGSLVAARLLGRFLSLDEVSRTGSGETGRGPMDGEAREGEE